MIKIYRHLLSKSQLSRLALFLLVLVSALSTGLYALAATTSEFTQAINPGTLSTDIVDASYVAVTSPSFTMSAAPFSFACQASTGTFGSATQQLYVRNPDAADSGWTLSLAASAPTAFWDSTTSAVDFDFNDPDTAGCGDGADADSLEGQMTIDASGATLAAGACSGCDVTNITKGASTAFNQGTTDSITLLNAAAGSNDIGDWTLQGVSVSQQIPAEQPAASDYKINLSLSIVAN